VSRLNNLSQEFIDKFFQLASGKIDSEKIELFLTKIESRLNKFYFTYSSEINLLRLLDNQFHLNLFVSDLLKYEHYIDLILTIVTYSNYLTDIIVKHPNYFYFICNGSATLSGKINKYYSERIKNIDLTKISFNSKINSLRNFKKQEILRLGILDYFYNENIIRITKSLSQLANQICNFLFLLCIKEIKNKYKINKLPNYCLISLGKLGGEELNYSSDIDLILFTEYNLQISNNLNTNKVYEEVVKLFINKSSEISPQGDLYRIDFRLRPYGRNSELVNTLSEYLYYYEHQSEFWERQMLIKSSFVSGSKKLFNKFYEYIQNLIYPKTFFSSPVDKLKYIKNSIEIRLKDEVNIKLSSGGIRDIEFSVQALQIFNGGKDKELREKNTLKALNKLFKKKLITKDEFKSLKSNYILFRKIEHFLQLMNNLQTHHIPDNGEILEKLSFFLEYKSSLAFKEDIENKRKFNSSFFNQIISSDKTDNLFDKINFKERKKAISNYIFLSTGVSTVHSKKFDEYTINSFNQISNHILNYLSNSKNPDKTLDNFVRIIKSYSIPQYWYDLFKDIKFLNITLEICDKYKFLLNCLLENESVRDYYISRNAFVKINESSLIEFIPLLFKFSSSLQFITGIIDLKKFFELNTKFYSKNILHLIEKDPRIKTYVKDLVVLGFGSFATEEMNLFSDIDLIFVSNNIEKFIDAQYDFQNLLNKIKSELNIEVDCRLRPEGRSSQLVWNFDDLINYIEKRARIWELLSYSKSMLIAGDKHYFDLIIKKLSQRILMLDNEVIKKELLEMRNKLVGSSEYLVNLKKVSGGLIDIAFIIGYYYLLNLNNLPYYSNSTIERINYLIEHNNQFREIENNFILLKKFEIYYQIVSSSKSVKIDFEDENFFILSEIFEKKSINELQDLFKKVFQSNIRIFNNTFQ